MRGCGLTRHRWRLVWFIAFIFSASAPAAHAQNLAGVFPPLPVSKQLDYRAGWRPGENGGPDRYAQRIHYQERFAGRFLWRGIVQVNDADGEGLDFDFAQAEFFWLLTDENAPWSAALRFDARVREGSEPEEFALNLANEFRLTSKITARFNILTKREIGDQRRQGLRFETRSNLFMRTDGGVIFGVESYNDHGSTADLDFYGPSQRQQTGPFAVWPLGDEFFLLTSALFGLNAQSPDADFRIWVQKNF
ncbi:MAG: hypothetical protein AAFX08_00080 [Pseudomonadota bacterium]